MRQRPPQHRVDAPIIWVPPGDPAWNVDRIEREHVQMRKKKLSPEDHPVARYLGGFTRYDLDAEATLLGKTVKPRDYLDESKAPEKWYLRRLDWQEFYRIQGQWEQERLYNTNTVQCFIEAARIGVVKVENFPVELEGLEDGRLTHGDMELLRGFDAPNLRPLVVQLGLAVYQASMPLTEAEKKA